MRYKRYLREATVRTDTQHRGYYGAALHAASWRGRSKIIEILLAHVADLDARGGERNTTALQEASSKGRSNTMAMLLAHGADVEAICARNSTALQYAFEQGHGDIVELLLAHGATDTRAVDVAEEKDEAVLEEVRDFSLATACGWARVFCIKNGILGRICELSVMMTTSLVMIPSRDAMIFLQRLACAHAK